METVKFFKICFYVWNKSNIYIPINIHAILILFMKFYTHCYRKKTRNKKRWFWYTYIPDFSVFKKLVLFEQFLIFIIYQKELRLAAKKCCCYENKSYIERLRNSYFLKCPKQRQLFLPKFWFFSVYFFNRAESEGNIELRG